MNGATEKPTPRQRHRLRQLLLSSVFTAEEAHRASVWLASPAATKDRASEVIDDALARIKARDNAKKASADRRAEYHANKDNGEWRTSPPAIFQRSPPPMANRPQNPHLNPHLKVRQLLYQLPHLKRSRQYTALMAFDYTDKNEAAAAASKAIFG